jgi:ferredoxin
LLRAVDEDEECCEILSSPGEHKEEEGAGVGAVGGQRPGMMRLRVDSDRCVGHGRCYELAPQVFDEDARGHCRIRKAVVPPGLEGAARVAFENCPEDAIIIEES